MSDALRIRTGEFGRVALLDMDRSLVRHAHPHCHVLLKVDGSNTSFLVGDRVAPLTDETAVLVNAWTPHAYIHRHDAPRTIILALYIEPHWLGNFRSNWVSSGDAGFFGSTAGEVTPRIKKLAVELASCMVHAPTSVKEHERILGDLMVAVIERFSEWKSVGAILRENSRTNSVDWRIRKAISLIKNDKSTPESVDRLAKDAGMSRANFFRVFEQSTGVTPRVFMNVIRLERAVHAAVHSDVSFGDLSDELGFSTQAHFTRFFRDHAGVAPSHFRSISRLGDVAEFLRI